RAAPSGRRPGHWWRLAPGRVPAAARSEGDVGRGLLLDRRREHGAVGDAAAGVRCELAGQEVAVAGREVALVLEHVARRGEPETAGGGDLGPLLLALAVGAAPVLEQRASVPGQERPQVDETEHLVIEPVGGPCGDHARVGVRDEDDRPRTLLLDVLDQLVDVVVQTYGGNSRSGLAGLESAERDGLGFDAPLAQLVRGRLPDPSAPPCPWHENGRRCFPGHAPSQLIAFREQCSSTATGRQTRAVTSVAEEPAGRARVDSTRTRSTLPAAAWNMTLA